MNVKSTGDRSEILRSLGDVIPRLRESLAPLEAAAAKTSPDAEAVHSSLAAIADLAEYEESLLFPLVRAFATRRPDPVEIGPLLEREDIVRGECDDLLRARIAFEYSRRNTLSVLERADDEAWSHEVRTSKGQDLALATVLQEALDHDQAVLARLAASSDIRTDP